MFGLCLETFENVWNVFGKCLECVWKAFGKNLKHFYKTFEHFHKATEHFSKRVQTLSKRVEQLPERFQTLSQTHSNTMHFKHFHLNDEESPNVFSTGPAIYDVPTCKCALIQHYRLYIFI